MEITTLIIALVLAFIAFKVLMGIVRIGAVIAIVVAAAWFLNGGMA